MAGIMPEQNPPYRLGDTVKFVRVVSDYMNKRKWTHKNLAEASGMSEAMISRMFHNTNGRGDTFRLTPEMVMQIAMGLEQGWDGYRALMEAAFPFFAKSLRDRTRASVTDFNV